MNTPPLEPSPANRSARAWVACLGLVLLALALWRLGLSIRVLSQGNLIAGQGAVVVHWRRLEPLVGWVALLLMWVGPEGRGLFGGTLRESRLANLFACATAIGVALALAIVGWDQWNLGTDAGNLLGFLADAWLALCMVAVIVREWAGLAADVPAGKVTLLHLFRFTGLQWTLAWLAALVYLRITMKREDLLGNEAARLLMFYLPALGVMINAAMGCGIGWWARFAGPPTATPRIRAWIVALVLMNLGLVGVIVRPMGLGIAGGALMILAVGLYLLGFPRGAFKVPGGQLVVSAWLVLALGAALLVAERAMVLISSSGGMPPVSLAFWGGAERALLGAGFVVLWVLGMAVRRTGRGGIVAAVAGAGLVLTAAFLVAASLRQGDNQLPALKMLVLGVGLEVAGLAGTGWIFWQSRKTF